MDDFVNGVWAVRWIIFSIALLVTVALTLNVIYTRPYDPRKGVHRGRNRNRGPDDPR